MIYLDNCATTKIRKEVLEILQESLQEDFANPSSLHRLGLKSEKQINESRKELANYLMVREDEIYFTSGGTESNNLAIRSMVKKMGKKGNHIITTKIEHPSILNVMSELEKDGYEISYLNVDSKGYINLDEFKNKLRKDTIIVSLIHVNNELGTIQDISSVSKIIEEKNSIALLHLDGVQSLGKIEVNLNNLNVDTYSFSGHKIHGPKGIGGIYVKKDTNLKPIIFGGNQERGLRSGTENLHGIIGIGEAVKILKEKGKKESEYVEEIRNYLLELINSEIDDIKINTPIENEVSPYILNISIRNTRAEVLLHYLENRNIYVSTTSACSSKGTEKSHVLKAIGLGENEIEGTLRLCLSYENTKEDMDIFVKALKESVNEIRDIIMR